MKTYFLSFYFGRYIFQLYSKKTEKIKIYDDM